MRTDFIPPWMEAPETMIDASSLASSLDLTWFAGESQAESTDHTSDRHDLISANSLESTPAT